MPRSGQHFDPRVLERSELLRELWSLAAPLLSGGAWPSLEEYTALVERERRSRAAELPPVRFAPMVPRQRRARTRGVLDLGSLYDGRIALHDEVPCLESSYHDLFNALVWAAFPRSKRALHQRQFRALERWLPPGASCLPNRRSREQDALTLFDEGGSLAIVVESEPSGVAAVDPSGVAAVDPSGIAAVDPSGIAAVDPSSTAAVTARARVARVIPFGHAVMEHLCFEPTVVRSAAIVVSAAAIGDVTGRALLAALDTQLSRRLQDVREFCTPDFDAVISFEPPARWSVCVQLGEARRVSG